MCYEVKGQLLWIVVNLKNQAVIAERSEESGPDSPNKNFTTADKMLRSA